LISRHDYLRCIRLTRHLEAGKIASRPHFYAEVIVRAT
jgi:hypothetical protein